MHSVCKPHTKKKKKWKKQEGKASPLINVRDDTQTRTHSISKYRMVHQIRALVILPNSSRSQFPCLFQLVAFYKLISPALPVPRVYHPSNVESLILSGVAVQLSDTKKPSPSSAESMSFGDAKTIREKQATCNEITWKRKIHYSTQIPVNPVSDQAFPQKFPDSRCPAPFIRFHFLITVPKSVGGFIYKPKIQM